MCLGTKVAGRGKRPRNCAGRVPCSFARVSDRDGDMIGWRLRCQASSRMCLLGRFIRCLVSCGVKGSSGSCGGQTLEAVHPLSGGRLWLVPDLVLVATGLAFGRIALGQTFWCLVGWGGGHFVCVLRLVFAVLSGVSLLLKAETKRLSTERFSVVESCHASLSQLHQRACVCLWLAKKTTRLLAVDRGHKASLGG